MVALPRGPAYAPVMPRKEFQLSHRIRVRWSEVDPQGIVFNAHYLTYFDVAAAEYWRALGESYPESFHRHSIDTFVVKATLEYHRSAHYDDELEVCARVVRIGRTSLSFALEIHRGTDHLLSGELIYVIGNLETQAPVRVPDWLRRAIAAYEVTPPEGV